MVAAAAVTMTTATMTIGCPVVVLVLEVFVVTVEGCRQMRRLRRTGTRSMGAASVGKRRGFTPVVAVVVLLLIVCRRVHLRRREGRDGVAAR